MRTTKTRHQFYLPDALSAKLDALADRPGGSKTAILTDALTAWFDREAAAEVDRRFGPRFDRLTRTQTRVEEKLDVITETLGAFIQHEMTLVAHQPPFDAATGQLTDHAKLPREGRNILRLMFGSDHVRSRNEEWESIARFVVGAFRADVARAGASTSAEVTKLVTELCGISPEFDALWQDNDVVAHGEGVKRIHHPDAGLLGMEFSSFAVEGRPELGMIIYNPASSEDAERLRVLQEGHEG